MTTLKIVIYEADPTKNPIVITLRNVKPTVTKEDVEGAVRQILSKMGTLE